MDKKWWTLLAVCAATFMLLLDVTIVTVALPNIQHDLHATFGGLQWVLDAYALTLASLLLTAGSLADLYGQRLLFVTGLVIFTCGSLLCGLAQSSEMLILSRSGQGVGGAIMFATALSLLAHSFHGKERGTAFGVWGAVTGIATALGPILGGLITSGITWRGIFLVNVPVGVVAVAVTLTKIEEFKTPHAKRPDLVGFGLLTAGLGSLVYGLIRASELRWDDEGVLICMVLAAVLLVAFLVVEAVVDQPMFDLSLFRTPTFVGGSVAALAMNGSLFALLLYLVLYLQDALGLSALAVGLRLAIISGATMIVATLSGRLSAHMPVRWLIGPGLVIVGAGLLVMGGIQATSGWTHLIPGLLLGGVGAGLVNPPLASTAVGVVEPQRSGMASGVNTTFRQIGIATSIAALGSIFIASLRIHLERATAGLPAVASHSGAILTNIRNGYIPQALDLVPPGQRAALGHAIRSSFVAGLNEILVIAGVIALVGGVVSAVLIRSRDFVPSGPPVLATRAQEPTPTPT